MSRKALCSLFSLLPILFSFATAASQEPSTGLLFPQNNGAWGSRGSLLLAGGHPVKIEGALSVEFRLSLLQQRYFGYILGIKDDHGRQLRLALSPLARNRDSVSFILSANQLTVHTLTVPWKEVSAPHAVRVALRVYPDQNMVSVSIGSHFSEAKGVHNLPASSITTLFGHSEDSWEVPPMVLSELRFSSFERTAAGWRVLHVWNLRDTDGSEAADSMGKAAAIQQDCEWIAAAHSKWILRHSLDGGVSDCAVYDNARSTLTVVGTYSLQHISLDTGTIRTLEYAQRRPGRTSDMKVVFDQANRRILAYHTGIGEATVLDEDTGRWSLIDTSNDRNRHHYDHLALIDSSTGGLYAFGGYGWYTTKNTVQRYNEHTRGWTEIDMGASQIPAPRFGSVAARGDSMSTWYVFGGKGNATGEQAGGYLWFKELWLLDLQKQTWSMNWASDTSVLDMMPIGLAHRPGSRDLYFAGCRQRGDTCDIRMFLLGIESARIMELPGLQIVGASVVPLLFTFDFHRGEFFTAIRHDLQNKSRIELYSLRFPPEIRSAREQERTAAAQPGMLVGIGVAIFLIVIVGMGLRRRNRQSREISTRTHERLATTAGMNGRRSPIPRPCSVSLFGGFHLHDATGVDRTSEFSHQIRELFLLILLHTRDGNGIPAQDLTSYLWPHALSDSAKNSRGVAIHRLREILRGIGGVQIAWRNPGYRVQFGADWYVDYHAYMTLLGHLESRAEGGKVKELAEILRKGEFLPGINFSWLVSVRERELARLTHTCAGLMSQQHSDDDSSGLLHIADYILHLDRLNEPALRLKLRALTMAGQHDQAARTFAEYNSLFLATCGRPSGLQLKNLTA